MVCICSCGKEYGFEPVGYWCCPACWGLNYTGNPLKNISSPEIEPDAAEEMYRSDTDFDTEANQSASSNPESWKSWYAIGLAYANRLNLAQTGMFWTLSLCLIDSDAEAESFIQRTQRMFVEIFIRDRILKKKYNAPHLASMEYHCMRRLPDRGKFYCQELADMLIVESQDQDADIRFSMVNLCSRIRISGLTVHPDLISHKECLERIVKDVDSFCFQPSRGLHSFRRAVSRRHFQLSLWLTMPYRIALTDTERVISDTDTSEIMRLASLQPYDGTAGFTSHLLNAVQKGGELALLRAERKHDEELVTELEDTVVEEIRQYLDKYIAGDQQIAPDNRVMPGPPEFGIMNGAMFRH